MMDWGHMPEQDSFFSVPSEAQLRTKEEQHHPQRQEASISMNPFDVGRGTIVTDLHLTQQENLGLPFLSPPRQPQSELHSQPHMQSQSQPQPHPQVHSQPQPQLQSQLQPQLKLQSQLQSCSGSQGAHMDISLSKQVEEQSQSIPPLSSLLEEQPPTTENNLRKDPRISRSLEGSTRRRERRREENRTHGAATSAAPVVRILKNPRARHSPRSTSQDATPNRNTSAAKVRACFNKFKTIDGRLICQYCIIF